MKLLLSILFLFTAYGSVEAQTKIQGQTIDSLTTRPIEGVSIFINGSSIGTISDKTGYFDLTIPLTAGGLLVFSSVNYKTTTIGLSAGVTNKMVVKMSLKESELESVTVTSSRYKIVTGRNWKNVFIEKFIGANAQDCKIKNFSDIVLKYSEFDDVLKAMPKKTIEIENKWLGYRVFYDIEDFKINYKTGVVSNYGYARFEDIGSGNQRIEDRRKGVYLGSLTHFIRTLFSNTFEQEGFSIRRISGTISSEGRVSPEQLSHYVLKEDSLIITDLEVVKELYVKYPIQVTYRYNPDSGSDSLSATRSVGLLNVRQTSFLSLQEDNSVFIFPSGEFLPPELLFVTGYWKEAACIKNILPFNYN